MMTAMDLPESLARTLWNIIDNLRPGALKGGGKAKENDLLAKANNKQFPGLSMPDTRCYIFFLHPGLCVRL